MLCVANDACSHWSFGKNSNKCYLKDSDAGRKVKSNVISGAKCNKGIWKFSCIFFFLAGNQLYDWQTNIDMKTKVVQHVPRIIFNVYKVFKSDFQTSFLFIWEPAL